jgi:CHAT domain-containing protein
MSHQVPSLTLEAGLLRERFSGQNPAERDELVATLKEQADLVMRADIQRCLQICALIEELANLSADPGHQALALLAKANAHTIGLGDYRQGIELYNQAAEIYGRNGRLVEQARAQIGKIYALMNLGLYTDALQTGEWASEILQLREEWLLLAKMKVNLAIMQSRRGLDAEALELFEAAKAAYQQAGKEGDDHWLRVELNRAVVLHNLGRYEDAAEASRQAAEKHLSLGQKAAAAHAQQNLAQTYFAMGRFNEALELLDQAHHILLEDGRQRDAMLAELDLSHCLLQLRRFPEVLEKCREMRHLFSAQGTDYEVAQANLIEASAYAGLKRYPEALGSLAEARRIFQDEKNEAAAAGVELQAALVLIEQGELEQGLEQAQSCARVFKARQLPQWQARAELAAAQGALSLGRQALALEAAGRALEMGERRQLPAIRYQAHHLLGLLAAHSGRPDEALQSYEQAIGGLEGLVGRLMVEFRADFIADKERLYGDAVSLCLDIDRPAQALEFAERAKSRALLDLLARRLDLSIAARNEADRPLVEELSRLRFERDRLYRRQEVDLSFSQRGEAGLALDESGATPAEVLALEGRITQVWHQLLVRNADYARDAALWQVRTEPVQPYLDEHTLLLEYFSQAKETVIFLVSQKNLEAQRLAIDLAQVQRYLQLLWLNLNTVPRAGPERSPALGRNAQGLLGKLYELLLDPVAGKLSGYNRLIIVPHGPLHYVPFQALHDGEKYFIEKYELSYLPGASLLRYCREAQASGQGALAVGHSYGGRLPEVMGEARTVAGLWGGQALLEERATVEALRAEAGSSRILHLATHGDFRPDNPLFSGLALADGWLTTLDIFNLRLQASLVTLSACQTGRSVVGGGNELLGLMRSFLAAGAASLVATLWAVEDRSTSDLMREFYQSLAAGETKSAALRRAQLGLLGRDEVVGGRHPYFWAPFFLVGDPDEL